MCRVLCLTLNMGFTVEGDASLAVGSVFIWGEVTVGASAVGLVGTDVGEEEGSPSLLDELKDRFRFLGSVGALAPASRASIKREHSCNKAEKNIWEKT